MFFDDKYYFHKAMKTIPLINIQQSYILCHIRSNKCVYNRKNAIQNAPITRVA